MSKRNTTNSRICSRRATSDFMFKVWLEHTASGKFNVEAFSTIEAARAWRDSMLLMGCWEFVCIVT